MNFKKREMVKLTKWILPYFKPYKKLFFGHCIFSILDALGWTLWPLIIKYIFSASTKLTIADIFWWFIIFVLINILEFCVRYFDNYWGHLSGYKIEADLRQDLFSHIQTLSFEYFDKIKLGQLVSRVTNDIKDISELINHGPSMCLMIVVKAIFSFIVLVRINIGLTLILFSLLPIIVIFTVKFNKKLFKLFKTVKQKLGEINAKTEDSLLGIKTVKSFGNENFECDKFNTVNKSFLETRCEIIKNMSIYMSWNYSFQGIMFMIVIILGCLCIMQGKIIPGDLIAYLMYIDTLLFSINLVAEFSETFQHGITGISRIKEIIETKSQIEDAPNTVDINKLKGDIKFENVSFKHYGNETNVFTNMNLHIECGKNIAFVGASGVGKSTLCNLIPRFYDILNGRILVDDIDIKNLKQKFLKNQIGIVQQDIYLFAGSILDNIAYGNLNANRSEIEQAAKDAGAHEFIIQLENGYDTYIGERGTRLSGGQRQRISIARVFLKNPSILILDEATSALDNASEAIIQKSLKKLTTGKTTLIIAHRLTTVQNANEIFVLTKNGISEHGTHEELINKNGYYKNLYNFNKKI